MKQIKITSLFLLSVTTLLLQTVLVPSVTWEAQAQSNVQSKTRRKVTFKSPKGQGAPKVTVGGGRRDSGMCEQSETVGSTGVKSQTIDKTLVPLLPTSKLGLTTSSHPSFMVYVPPTSAKTLEFTLENEEGEGIYQTQVDIEKAPGVISVKLPQEEAALEANKDYRFIVSIICQQDGPKNPFVDGLVRRISPKAKLTSNPSKPDSLEQVMLYSNSGQWFEALTSLANMKMANPNDPEIKAAWESLLSSVGLDAIASAQLQPTSTN